MMAKFTRIALAFVMLMGARVHAERPFSRYNDVEALYTSGKPYSDGKGESEAPAQGVAKKPSQPRVFYLGLYAGWTMFDNDLGFRDSSRCGANPSNNLLCVGAAENPIEADLQERMFLTGAAGVNSEGPMRIELSYFQLASGMAVSGENTIVDGADRHAINYAGKIDAINGGTANLYLDFITYRNRPGSVFVPYIMAGIGSSQIKMDDLTFASPITAGNTFTIEGKKQNVRTVVLGAGFSIGLNNYISFDVGYRYYDFDKVKPSSRMVQTDSVGAYVDERNDIKMEMELDAHIATAGIKFQI
jgi:opacity protein-like surface antigen